MRRLSTLWLAIIWLAVGMPQVLASPPQVTPARTALKSTAPDKTTEGPATVSNISIRPGAAGEVAIDVATTKSATFHVYRFDHPDRLVMDVEGMRNAVRRNLIPVSSPVVKDVRVGQFRDKDPEVVRVVADLSDNPLYEAHAYAGGVLIEVKPRLTEVSRAVAPTPVPTPKPAAKREEAKPVPPAPVVAERRAPAAVPTPKPAAKREEAKPVPPAPVVAERQAPAAVPTPKPAAKRDEAKLVQSAPVVAARQVPVTPPHPTKSSVPQPKAGIVPNPSSVAVSLPASNEKTVTPGHSTALPGLDGTKDAAATPRQQPQVTTPEVLRAEKAAKTLMAENASPPSGYEGQAAMGLSPGEEKPAYTGELISLNLKDVDLKDFLRLIHEISGLNILVDPNVSGSVTTVLDNVPWDQALDIVLRNNGLGKVLEGNILRIAKLDTLAGEQETQNRMVAARLEAAPMVSVFRAVNYAKASDIATLLRTWAGGKEGSGALSKRGTVLVDDRTNTLIISDVATRIPIIEDVIAKLDTKTKQVAIEARIVLANSSFQRTLAAALVGGANVNSSGSTLGALQTGTGASITPNVTGSPTGTAPSPAFTVVQNPSTGFGVVAITNQSARYIIDAAISAAEIRSQAKTISRPSIITQNNAQGMVQQGAQIPTQTSINNTISVQYVNATLMLTVTPQVTDDGHIFLKMNVQNASPGTIITNAAVSINIQQATTQVLVPDGGTVVFGGVTVTQRTNSITQIPLLGNIPILGNLFKTTNVQDNDQELLFFVSPKLLATT